MADSEHESSILYWDSCVLKYLITIIDVVVLPYLVHTTSAATYSSSSSSAVVTSSLCVVRPDYSMYTCSAVAVIPLRYQYL